MKKTRKKKRGKTAKAGSFSQLITTGFLSLLAQWQCYTAEKKKKKKETRAIANVWHDTSCLLLSFFLPFSRGAKSNDELICCSEPNGSCATIFRYTTVDKREGAQFFHKWIVTLEQHRCWVLILFVYSVKFTVLQPNAIHHTDDPNRTMGLGKH